MKGLNQIPLIIGFALLLSCSGGKQSEIISDNSYKSDWSNILESSDPYQLDSIAYGIWGDPSSLSRNEERYIDFLREFLAIDSLPEALRLRAEERLHIASLNRKDSVATDFEFLDRNGNYGSLHGLHGRRILLLFYDPECPHCSDILQYIADSPEVNNAIDNKALTVVAIYAESKRNIWDNTKADMPANWIVGYDRTRILDKELYDLPAMPTPYLLDSTHRVLLKDPSPSELISVIDQDCNSGR